MNNVEQSTGIGCLSSIGIVFLILKLTNLINWSRWLVLLPFYLPLILILVFVILLIWFA